MYNFSYSQKLVEIAKFKKKTKPKECVYCKYYNKTYLIFYRVVFNNLNRRSSTACTC